MTFTYEYRGFKYSKEAKKCFKEYGLKISKIIDNYIDKGIYKISIEDKYFVIELNFTLEYNEFVIIANRLIKNPN